MKWLIFFLMLPHLKPPSFEYMWPALDTLFNAGRVVSAVIILFLYLLKMRLPSKPVWALAILQVWILVATYLNGAELWNPIINTVSILSVVLLIDLFVDCMRPLLSGMLLNLEIMLYCNLLSVLLYYPNGMYISNIENYKCYFLGYHNGFILYALPAICVALIYMAVTGRRIRPILLIVASCLSIVITWSATSICGLLVIGGLLLIGKSAFRDSITFPHIFIVALVVDLAIAVFRIMDRVMWFAWMIEAFLKKQVTLTGRTFVWDAFYKYFFESPWIGYGNGAKIRSTMGAVLSHTHNQWFQMLFEGGILALFLFLIFNLLVGKRLVVFRKSKYTYIFLSVLAALYIIFIAEVYSSPWLYMIYILAYHVDKFEYLSPDPQNKLARCCHVQNTEIPQKY